MVNKDPLLVWFPRKHHYNKHYNEDVKYKCSAGKVDFLTEEELVLHLEIYWPDICHESVLNYMKKEQKLSSQKNVIALQLKIERKIYLKYLFTNNITIQASKFFFKTNWR